MTSDRIAPDEVAQHASELFAAAEHLLGDRVAEQRYDEDRGLRITVLDLTDADRDAIAAAAYELGIGDWVRVDLAEPADLQAWERLRHDLLRLQAAEPRPLKSWPTPTPGYRRPPVPIALSADVIGEGTAAELHAQYGEFVRLRVGALPYPPVGSPASDDRPPPRVRSGGRSRRGRREARRAVDPGELRVELDGPLSVPSGSTARHAILVTNLSEAEVVVRTNGHVIADVLDETGAVVGGYSGAQHRPGVIFAIAPGQTSQIPLLVGTASFVAELGYRLPPGVWRLVAPLALSDGRELETPPLPLAVTAT